MATTMDTGTTLMAMMTTGTDHTATTRMATV